MGFNKKYKRTKKPLNHLEMWIGKIIQTIKEMIDALSATPTKIPTRTTRRKKHRRRRRTRKN